jgi:hypothetical protein
MIKSRRIRWVTHVARMVAEEEKKNAQKVLMGKPEGRRPLGRPRHRWEDNVKME